MQPLVEFRRLSVMSIAVVPGSHGVADDREQPRPALPGFAAPEAAEVAKRAQGRFLHDVLRVVGVPRQVARQRVGGVQMWEHDRFESLEFARLQPVLKGARSTCRIKTPRAAGLFAGEYACGVGVSATEPSSDALPGYGSRS